MDKLFETANRYVKTSDWKMIAVLKFCLISLGMMIGMTVDKKDRKPFLIGAVTVFISTYVPLMVKFFKIFTGKE